MIYTSFFSLQLKQFTIKDCEYLLFELNCFRRNLIKEIIPSQSIQIEENNVPSINGDRNDFSVICRVIDNKIIAYNFTGPIECNNDTGQCKYTVQ